MQTSDNGGSIKLPSISFDDIVAEKVYKQEAIDRF